MHQQGRGYKSKHAKNVRNRISIVNQFFIVQTGVSIICRGGGTPSKVFRTTTKFLQKQTVALLNLGEMLNKKLRKQEMTHLSEFQYLADCLILIEKKLWIFILLLHRELVGKLETTEPPYISQLERWFNRRVEGLQLCTHACSLVESSRIYILTL